MCHIKLALTKTVKPHLLHLSVWIEVFLKTKHQIMVFVTSGTVSRPLRQFPFVR